MAKHLQITNENNNVIIDDSYMVPMLIWKGGIHCATPRPPINPDFYEYWIRMYTSGDWLGEFVIFDIRAGDAPFLHWFPWETHGDFSAIRCREISGQLLVACRSRTGDLALARASLTRVTVDDNPDNDRIRFVARAEAIIQGDDIVVCIYSIYPLRPRNYSMTIYNQEGRMIYDALRPPFHFLGSMYGGVNAANNPAAVYDMPLPPMVDPIHVFLTAKSTMPYWAAYRIHSGGVSWADTQYKAVLEFPSTGWARVTLWRVRGVNGNNSTYARNLYFENLIYCPYPFGNYF